MDTRKVDYGVANAILFYVSYRSAKYTWGETTPEEIIIEMKLLKDRQDYVSVSPLFQWIQKQESKKLGSLGNSSLNRFRHYINRASR